MNKKITFKHNDIDYLLYKTKRYKSIIINLMFVRPLKKEDITYYTLLNRLIGSTTATYKTKKELSTKMYGLYDASIYLSTNYAYKTAFNSFKFQIINGKLIDDNSLMEEAIALLKDIIFNPNIKNNAFLKKDFDEEKRSLTNDIKNIYNNKRKYAYRRLLEIMAPDDILSASLLGDLNVLNAITPESLYAFYQTMLKESKVLVGVIGDISEEEVIKYIGLLPLKTNNDLDFVLSPNVLKSKAKIQEVKETQEIMQAKLMMGFVYNVNFDDQNYVPLLVFNAMFGGMFSSTLFKVIREENSLAYDISSDVILNKKIMVVSGGIENSNVNRTCDIVIKELEKYKDGIIDEELLKIAKDFLINDIKEMEDSPNALLNYSLEATISKKQDLDDIIKNIQGVTKEDIIKVSNLITLDSIFELLPGDENE